MLPGQETGVGCSQYQCHIPPLSDQQVSCSKIYLLWFQFNPIIDTKGLDKELLGYTLTAASFATWASGLLSGNNHDLDPET